MSDPPGGNFDHFWFLLREIMQLLQNLRIRYPREFALLFPGENTDFGLETQDLYNPAFYDFLSTNIPMLDTQIENNTPLWANYLLIRNSSDVARSDNSRREPCVICGRVILRRNISAHLNTHLTERTRDYVCHMCGRRYFYARDLRTHMRRNHL